MNIQKIHVALVLQKETWQHYIIHISVIFRGQLNRL